MQVHQLAELYNRFFGVQDDMDQPDTAINEASEFDLIILEEYLTEDERKQFLDLVELIEHRMGSKLRQMTAEVIKNNLKSIK